jgi:ABC-type glycerol-3-phosphate transport system substrate-binding protein
MFHAKKALCAAGLCVAFLSPAHAVIEIQCWHSQTGAVSGRVLELADQFNKSQSDYKVIATHKGGYDEAMAAAIAALRAGNAPNILQVFEVGTATMMHAKSTVVPVADLMKKADESFDPSGYVPAVAGYDTSARGEMQSLPFNASTTVFYYSKGKFAKAGLDPEQPPVTWQDAVSAMSGKSGKSANENRGVARLFKFLSQPEVQAKWHQDTNYLPTTRVVYELTSQSGFYHNNPGADIAVQQMIVRTTDKSRGIGFGDFVQVRGIIDEELENVWSGKKTAKQALDAAVKRGDEQLVWFEKANR